MYRYATQMVTNTHRNNIAKGGIYKYRDLSVMDFQTDPYWESIAELIDYFFNDSIRVYAWIDDLTAYQATNSQQAWFMDKAIFRNPDLRTTATQPAFAVFPIRQFLGLWDIHRKEFQYPWGDQYPVNMKGCRFQFGFPGFVFEAETCLEFMHIIDILQNIVDPVICDCGDSTSMCRCVMNHPRGRNKVRVNSFMYYIWECNQLDGENPRYFTGDAPSVYAGGSFDEYEWMRNNVMPEWFRLFKDGVIDPTKTNIAIYGHKGSTPEEDNFSKVPKRLVQKVLTTSGLDDDYGNA